jgi:imidazolonepropionase-like amidohydrolase
MRHFTFAALVFALAGTLTAALPAPGIADEPILVRGGTVHTMGPNGTLENADVLVIDGHIAAVGPNLDEHDDARVIDARGKHVTPGLMTLYSHAGLVEISMVAETRDINPESDSGIGAALDVHYAINPRSSLIPFNRSAGITRALIAPRASTGIFAGRGALIHLGDGDDIVMVPRAAMFAELGARGSSLEGGSRAAAWTFFRNALDETRDYRQNRMAYEFGRHRDHRTSLIDVRALVPVTTGETPLFVHVNRASDIRQVIRLASQYGLRVVLIEAAEGWIVASELAEAGIPVILNPLRNLPSQFEMMAATLENAARLHAAGVTISFFTDRPGHNDGLIRQNAGNAVANGLPWEAGLAAITSAPAAIIGVGERLGQIAPGMEADLVVWDGDPLELSTFADVVVIAGKEVPLGSRAIELRERYRDLSGPESGFGYR